MTDLCEGGNEPPDSLKAVHGGREHRSPVVDVFLMMRSGAHDGTLGARGAGVVVSHAGHVSSRGGTSRDARPRVVRPCHGGGGCRVAVSGLRHLAARREVSVGAGHVAQPRGVHAGGRGGRERAAGSVEARLVEIRVVHDSVVAVHFLVCSPFLALFCPSPATNCLQKLCACKVCSHTRDVNDLQSQERRIHKRTNRRLAGLEARPPRLVFTDDAGKSAVITTLGGILDLKPPPKANPSRNVSSQNEIDAA
ncbi:hypothetical protein ANN_18253 [Periplaneta americana]|uniref:Uncharacterized protein n=1 Tax=Periplaneta americana TaxID=6978 RepID=A0ABQ8SPP4_PERAM|nr:hypothetical protein ANN_18253 [Periplaneta americana]